MIQAAHNKSRKGISNGGSNSSLRGAHVKNLGNRDEEYGNVNPHKGVGEVDPMHKQVSGGGSPGSYNDAGELHKRKSGSLGHAAPTIEDRENEDLEIDEGIENGKPRQN